MCSSVMKQLTLVLLCYLHYSAALVDSQNGLTFHNQFAVHIPNATEVLVQLIAEKHGFRSLGQVWYEKSLFMFAVISWNNLFQLKREY